MLTRSVLPRTIIATLLTGAPVVMLACASDTDIVPGTATDVDRPAASAAPTGLDDGTAAAAAGTADLDAAIERVLRHVIAGTGSGTAVAIETDGLPNPAVGHRVAGSLGLPVGPRDDLVRCPGGPRSCSIEGASRLVRVTDVQRAGADTVEVMVFHAVDVEGSGIFGDARRITVARADGMWAVVDDQLSFRT